MKDVRLSLPTLALVAVVIGAAAYAAGRAMPSASSTPPEPPPAAEPASTEETPEPLPPGHPPAAGTEAELPAGHPPIGGADQAGGLGASPGGQEAPSVPAQSSLQWKAPARWKLVPNASTMRLATYTVPRAPGDPADAELSITRAGGSVDANADRWIGQFDAAGQQGAKKTTRKVGTLDVLVVEVQGTYAGGMGRDSSPQSGWALVGAIVSTPDMPHFFKLTGPAKSVAVARKEFDALIGSLVQR